MNALEAIHDVRTIIARVSGGPAEGLFVLLTPLSDAGDVWDVEFSAPVPIDGQVMDEPMDVRVSLQADRAFLASYEIEPVSGATRSDVLAHFPRVTRFVNVAG